MLKYDYLKYQIVRDKPSWLVEVGLLLLEKRLVNLDLAKLVTTKRVLYLKVLQVLLRR